MDFRVAADSLDPEVLAPLWPQVKSRYQHLEVRNQWSAKVEARIGHPPDAQTADLGFYGLFLKTQDESRVAQFRANGVTVNQLGGYTTADELFAEALDLWRRYSELVRPETIVRVALRYMNRLMLPLRARQEITE